MKSNYIFDPLFVLTSVFLINSFHTSILFHTVLFYLVVYTSPFISLNV